jgi:hypothetical protein
VYFSPECHANYEALGFDPSRGDADGVALPDGPAYFASRGSLLGQVPGHVIAAAFGVFSAAVVVPAVELAWTRTDAATIRAARADGAVGQLRRLLGDRPDGVERVVTLLARAAEPLPVNGRPLAAGIAALDVPDDPLAAAWHLGDFLREYRGDCHNAAWVAAGLTATDIGLLTELSWGMPIRSYSRTRGLDRATSSPPPSITCAISAISTASAPTRISRSRDVTPERSSRWRPTSRWRRRCGVGRRRRGAVRASWHRGERRSVPRTATRLPGPTTWRPRPDPCPPTIVFVAFGSDRASVGIEWRQRDGAPLPLPRGVVMTSEQSGDRGRELDRARRRLSRRHREASMTTGPSSTLGCVRSTRAPCRCSCSSRTATPRAST